MKKIKVGINGLGRIGRTVLREYFNRNLSDIEIIAINNPGNIKNFAHLLKYDSVHGTFQKNIQVESNALVIDGETINFFHESDPGKIQWSELKVDIVIDATGVFRDHKSLSKHLGGSVKKVILCSPGQDLDATLVMGINSDQYLNEKHHIVSNASCTTNCLAPLAKILNDNWTIENGFMTTIHSYTADQRLLDADHEKDPRRARAAAISMIPTSTGAAKALGIVIPELNNKLDGYAIRVPTPNVSMVDFTVNLKNSASIEEINKKMKEASNSGLKDILGYSTEYLVGCDFMGNRCSSIFDSTLTYVIDKTIKVVAWYDNESGFSNRVLDLTSFIGNKL